MWINGDNIYKAFSRVLGRWEAINKLLFALIVIIDNIIRSY